MDADGSVTMDAGSDTAGETPSPVDTQTQDPGSTSQSAPASKTYTEDQLQRVVRGRIEQQNRSHQKQITEYRQKQAEYEAVVKKMNGGIEAMGRGFGFIQDEQPTPVTHESIQALQKQFDERLNQRFDEMNQRQIYTQIQGHWKGVEQKYADYASLPGFKDAWAKQWDPNKDPMSIAADLVSAYDKVFAAKTNAATATKEARLKAAPVKSGGGTASPSKGEEKIPLRKQMIAAIAASRE
jgi:hypothetical protein